MDDNIPRGSLAPPSRSDTLRSLQRTLTRSLSFLRLPNFSRYALPPLEFSSLSDDLRHSDADYLDSASDISSASDSGSEDEAGDIGPPTRPVVDDDDDDSIRRLPIRRQSSHLRWQSVPPRKPLPTDLHRDLRSQKSLRRSQSFKDPNLVTWDGKDDPRNPLNWPRRKKWMSTVLVSSFTFISPVASTMVAPALPDIADQFDIRSDIEQVLVMSIFLLAYAVGPFVLGPLSEVYGRVVVLQSANMLYLVFNTACGFAQTKEQMMAFRFLSGLGGSAPQAIGGGVLSDCWAKEERGSSLALYSLAPFIGPAVGPIAGGYITLHTTWRWIFWATSIVDTLIQVFAFLFLNETYHPAILGEVCKHKQKETGNMRLHTKWQTPDKTFRQLLRRAMLRPFLMLATQPALQAMAIYRAYGYGLMYLIFSTFPMVFQEQYDQDVGTASLHYISLGIGFVFGLQISGPLQDKTYKYLKTNGFDPSTPLDTLIKTLFADFCRHRRHRRQRRHHRNDIENWPGTSQSHPSAPLAITVSPYPPFPPPARTYTVRSDPRNGLPEHRLPLTLPSGLFMPLGLLIYGLSAASHTHWIVPDLGAALFCVGLIITFNCAQAYVVDAYTDEINDVNYAASATGAAAFVRTMAGFSFPLFAPRLYQTLGVGGGNALLAGVAAAVGLVAPVVLWRWGARLRDWGKGRL
ncbi:uncharacterized protein HMPREF1541_02914 [Cyphellophora europaea CBS 101466]|uniref:Major facilitator superfamily (MFS) profile domain-containing protein n=1 Tax=Cyphellophora europaea (strain CBS 101466) TaxID=1220924 RepID=W2S570_CYPE1|nr:uncharacterized protein HMPREF1541_02914 [Cyphellophora europaea CBS 101466]ETN43755.1 hypothetical protein HMPREF1541_02914 [Cyphellophora europaea CBS 101466]